MKRLILLIALLATLAASNSYAQAPRKVLVEEFTSSTCPPCAATDPMMQKFQADYTIPSGNDKMVVLKWHVNWPAPGNDPMYTLYPASAARSLSYYGNQYAPQLFFNGTFDAGLNSALAYATALEGVVDSIDATTSPFTIDVSQQITTDSIIANITIKSVGPLPTATDLRLGVVVAERHLLFTGTNGLPAHDYVARTAIPTLNSTTGALSTNAQYPAFSITQGGTNTYRYAAKINSKWNPNQLFVAVFIQSLGDKEVYQANWTIPNISAQSQVPSLVMAPTSDQMQISLKNNTSTSQNINVAYNSEYSTSGWNVTLSGISGNTLTLNSGETKNINFSVTSPTPAIGSAIGEVEFTTADGLLLGSKPVTFFGTDNSDVVVESGAGIAAAGKLLDVSLNTNGLRAGLINRDVFISGISDWNPYKNIFYICGTQLGLPALGAGTEWDFLDPYVNGGGHFFISSTSCLTGYYNTQYDPALQPWRDIFHIEPTANVTGTWGTLKGVTGDPVGDGINTTISPKVSIRQPISSYDDGMFSMFTNERSEVVGARALYGDGKSMYLSFDLEQLNATDQPVISKRIIDWFNGMASVKTSNEASAVTVTNYPNPVTKTTRFDYSVTERGLVSLALYDVMGRQVSSLVSNEMQDQGTYSADFNASHLANGSYTYVLTTGSKKVTGTMTVTK